MVMGRPEKAGLTVTGPCHTGRGAPREALAWARTVTAPCYLLPSKSASEAPRVPSSAPGLLDPAGPSGAEWTSTLYLTGTGRLLKMTKQLRPNDLNE